MIVWSQVSEKRSKQVIIIYLSQVILNAVSCVHSLGNPTIEADVNVIMLSPHLVRRLLHNAVGVRPETLRGVPLSLRTKDVVIAKFSP